MSQNPGRSGFGANRKFWQGFRLLSMYLGDKSQSDDAEKDDVIDSDNECCQVNMALLELHEASLN